MLKLVNLGGLSSELRGALEDKITGKGQEWEVSKW